MLKKLISFALAALMLCAMPLTVNAADSEFVVYENDFSDPATLSQFNQFRAKWEIRDGKLWITGTEETATDPFAHIILNNNSKWKNYTVEVDVENLQTSTGIVCHVNNELADGSTNDSFAGYLCYISNDATKGAMARSKPSDYTVFGGGYDGAVISCGTAPGSDVRLVVTVIDDSLTYTIYDLKDGKELYTCTQTTNDWPEGTVGLRARVNFTSANITSINTVSFDNLKVTLLGKEAEDAKAASVVTTAPVVTEASAVTTEPSAPESTPATGDSSALMAVMAAVTLCAAAALVIKKKAEN